MGQGEFTFAKFTEYKRTRYLKAIRKGSNLGESAAYAGISAHTARVYTRAHPEFAEAVRLAEEEGCEPIESVVRQKALSGNLTACFFWLQNRHPSRWSDKRAPAVIEVGGVGHQSLSEIKTELEQLLEQQPKPATIENKNAPVTPTKSADVQQ